MLPRRGRSATFSVHARRQQLALLERHARITVLLCLLKLGLPPPLALAIALQSRPPGSQEFPLEL
jgi:hypothetical protein